MAEAVHITLALVRRPDGRCPAVQIMDQNQTAKTVAQSHGHASNGRGVVGVLAGVAMYPVETMAFAATSIILKEREAMLFLFLVMRYIAHPIQTKVPGTAILCNSMTYGAPIISHGMSMGCANVLPEHVDVSPPNIERP